MSENQYNKKDNKDIPKGTDKNTALTAISVVAVFLVLVVVIYFIGRAKHKEPGMGLSQSVEREILVQYLVKVDPRIKMDIAPSAMAHRVAFDGQGQIDIHITNLLKERQKVKIALEVQPEKAKEAVRFKFQGLQQEFLPKGGSTISVYYSLLREKIQTIDGTIDMIIHGLPVSE